MVPTTVPSRHVGSNGPSRWRRQAGRPHRNLALDHGRDLRILRSPLAKAGAVLLALVYLAAPANLTDVTLFALCYAGVYAIGAIGLNLLIGFTGQVSLGHATFFGVGAYAAAYFGVQRELPLLAYLAIATGLGLLLGLVIGPFALRLRGQYLAVVTIGLVFLGGHIFSNWESVTGGGSGAPVAGADLSIGPLDFAQLELGGQIYTREQSLFWLVWALVALTALVAKNITRTRPGRAMQAIRDRDLSAEVIGVQLARYKVGAFAVAGAMAALAGALYGVLQGFVNADEFGGSVGLFLSITFVAMIIVGGVGTVFGSILGAVLVEYGDTFIRENNDLALLDPIIIASAGDSGLVSSGEFNGIVFGLLIVGFLLVEPRGLAALWLRLKAYFTSWPFSY